jgi:hypothetical protein
VPRPFLSRCTVDANKPIVVVQIKTKMTYSTQLLAP